MPKIDITPLKKAGIKGVTGELIHNQNTSMDIDDFLANTKIWETLLKKEGQK